MKKMHKTLMVLLLICSMLQYGCGAKEETAVQDVSDAGTEETDDTDQQDEAEISEATLKHRMLRQYPMNSRSHSNRKFQRSRMLLPNR